MPYNEAGQAVNMVPSDDEMDRIKLEIEKEVLALKQKAEAAFGSDMQSGNTAARQTQVSEKLGMMTYSIRELHDCIDRMEDRLTRVLIVEPQTGKVPSEAGNKQTPEVELAIELSSLNVEIRRAVTRIRDILSRCEL